MKLLSENKRESTILPGLCALLCDLDIEADGYRHDESIAVTFFTAEEFSDHDAMLHMSDEERLAFLQSIEDCMKSAMRKAGSLVVEKALRHASAGISHPDRHLG